ncbi:MAG TPA: tetratricopeptide repeat protein [Ferruginibacter sp.]|nr:tetratricopeptide repeat protein [Ferruginibacter sp.]
MKKNFTIALFLISAALFTQAQDSSSHFYQKGLEEKAGRKYLTASTYFEKATTLNPRFTAAYLENGHVNLSMRKTDMAIQNFSKAHELEPDNNAAIKELADLYYNYRQYQKAIDFANKCKGCENADRIIALSYFKMEDYAKVENALLPLLEKSPNDAELTYTLAKTYFEMELETKAIPVYVKAISLDGSKSQWSHELGLLYYNNNNFKGAVTYFNKAAEQGFIQSNDFKENLGFAYIYSGEFEKGEKLLLEIIARKPGDKEMLRVIADAYYQQKQYDKSLEFCQKLLEMDMKDGKALYQAGLCFQRKGQKDRGQQMCDKAIELDPSLNSLRQKKDIGGM